MTDTTPAIEEINEAIDKLAEEFDRHSAKSGKGSTASPLTHFEIISTFADGSKYRTSGDCREGYIKDEVTGFDLNALKATHNLTLDLEHATNLEVEQLEKPDAEKDEELSKLVTLSGTEKDQLPDGTRVRVIPQYGKEFTGAIKGGKVVVPDRLPQDRLPVPIYSIDTLVVLNPEILEEKPLRPEAKYKIGDIVYASFTSRTSWLGHWGCGFVEDVEYNELSKEYTYLVARQKGAKKATSKVREAAIQRPLAAHLNVFAALGEKTPLPGDKVKLHGGADLISFFQVGDILTLSHRKGLEAEWAAVAKLSYGSRCIEQNFALNASEFDLV